MKRPTTIVGAPPGAPPSTLLDHDLASPSWRDTVKCGLLVLAGVLGLAEAITNTPSPSAGAEDVTAGELRADLARLSAAQRARRG